ncbi:MAG TPA: Gfo/Idh/MocA family oxidoreductase [Chloroflexota bacterium]|nr:Gfo/Idh/MocA family oxidoreductase [Chloroflexota bacterium]
MTEDRSRIRVGVIGAGFIGPAHIESLRRLGYVDVVALAASGPESAEAKARQLSVPRAYGDYRDLIDDPDVDVVDISAPNIFHYPAARAALGAGKDVVCEKPLAMTSAEAAELVELAERSGRVNAVTFNIRFYPLVQHARALVRRGELGDVWMVHGGYCQDWLLLDTDYNWRVEAEQGGSLRAVGDIGSHWLDLAQFITDRPVTRVFAELSTFIPVRQKPAKAIETFSTAEVEREEVRMATEDAATILLHLGDTARGNLVVSQVSAGRKNRISIEINGSRGSLAWDGERPNELWIGHRERPNEVLIKDPALLDVAARPFARYPGGHDEGFADSHTAINRAIYDYIRAGGRASGRTPDFPTFADGYRENVIGDCILQSAAEGRWVDVRA